MPAPQGSFVALSGDSVVAAWVGRDRVLRVKSAPVAGGAATTLFTHRAPRRSEAGVLALDASAQRVAFVIADQRHGAEGLASVVAYTGPPNGPFVALSRYRLGDRWFALDVRVSGDRISLTEVTSDFSKARFTVQAGDGTAVAVKLPQTGAVGAAFAGDLVAFGRQDPARLVVRDWAAGATRLEVRPAGDVDGFDLREDGALVLQDESAAGDALRVADSAAPALRTVYSGHDIATVRWAGTRILALQSLRQLEVVDPADGSARLIGHPSAEIGRDEPEAAGIDADATRAVWTANGCVWSAGLDEPATLEVPEGPCPRAEVELVDDQPERLSSSGRLRLHIRCISGPAQGCTGRLRITTADRSRLLARAPFTLPPGADQVLRLRPRGLRGHHLTLVRARAVATDPAGRRCAAEIGTSVRRR